MSESHGSATQRFTTISISEVNYLVLKILGQMGDSFNDVLAKILSQQLEGKSVDVDFGSTDGFLHF